MELGGNLVTKTDRFKEQFIKKIVSKLYLLPITMESLVKVLHQHISGTSQQKQCCSIFLNKKKNPKKGKDFATVIADRISVHSV